jgi:uncharacterized phage-associated protein
MPYPASLIAYAFAKKGVEECNFVTQMKLQKMVYFAHGYHLAKYKEPLIIEFFEAWKFGPVVQSIYGIYRSYGNSYITEVSNRTFEKQLTTLSEAAKDAIEYTWKVTKRLSGTALSSWTHIPDSPWATSYIPNVMGVVIPNERIKDYFTNLLLKHAN